MARPRLSRTISAEPGVTYFKPAGIRLVDLEESVLTVDEFEAVRLKDLEGLEQEDCAKRMSISQPTFHRLVLSARKKIADSIVNGKAIRISGGNFSIAPRRAGRGSRGMESRGPPMSCICQRCGHTEQKQPQVPCSVRKCPECGAQMIRRD